jgi:hypothetical protein
MTIDIWIRDYNPPRCFQKKITGRSKHNVQAKRVATEPNVLLRIWSYILATKYYFQALLPSDVLFMCHSRKMSQIACFHWVTFMNMLPPYFQSYISLHLSSFIVSIFQTFFYNKRKKEGMIMGEKSTSLTHLISDSSGYYLANLKVALSRLHILPSDDVCTLLYFVEK